jgi:hypothetical protein
MRLVERLAKALVTGELVFYSILLSEGGLRSFGSIPEILLGGLIEQLFFASR